MHILCDTCSVLMLLRIAPDMFADTRYRCVTIRHVWDEIKQTQKFKSKYPWRTEYVKHVRSLSKSDAEPSDYQRIHRTVRITEQAQRNKRTGKAYGLSRRDVEIAACAVANQFSVCSTDVNLVDFLLQQYEISNMSPLQLVNDWLEMGLFEWTDFRQGILTEWIACNEPPQPRHEIRRFEEIAKRTYPVRQDN